MRQKQRNTLVLILVLLGELAAAFFVQRLVLHEEGATAVVRTGGETQELDLSRDTEFWVGDEEIGRNLIRVENGAVRVAEADCPDKICVETGPIQEEGEVIACLPHGVIIYIERGQE